MCRYWPRGVSRDNLQINEWMPEVAPNPELLEDWREGRINWDHYCSRYREEMTHAEEKIEELAEKAREGTVTLLCHEPEHHPHCHRHILKKMVTNRL